MEQLLSLLKELLTRNETLAKELGETQAEVQYWKNKFYREAGIIDPLGDDK